MVGQRSWMLLVACLGATVTTSPPNAVRPLSQLLSPTPLAQRQLKHEGLPCFCALLPEMMSGAPRAQCAVQSRQRRRGSLGLAATTASPLSGAWKRTEVDGRRTCAVYTPGGLVPYEEALRWQQALQRERIDHKVALRGQDEAPTLPDALILLEHPTVYTLGSSSEMSDMLFSMPKEDLSEVGSSVVVPAVGAEPAFQIHRVQRGGKVTYHAPGQLVGYPVFDLSRHSQDIAWYLRLIEQVLINSLADFGVGGTPHVCPWCARHLMFRVEVTAGTEEGLTGVWVDGRKIAAIGVGASRWVTLHGFALNVDPRMEGFTRIVPCGIRGREVCSLASVLADACPSLPQVRESVEFHFAEMFDLELLPAGSLPPPPPPPTPPF